MFPRFTGSMSCRKLKPSSLPKTLDKVGSILDHVLLLPADVVWRVRVVKVQIRQVIDQRCVQLSENGQLFPDDVGDLVGVFAREKGIHSRVAYIGQSSDALVKLPF